MTWRKFFTPVDNSGLPLNVQGKRSVNNQSFAADQSNNYLPEIYGGSPHRIMRYSQFDQMDLDPEINQCLDTIAEFGTQEDEYSRLPFIVEYEDDPSQSESEIISRCLKQWVNLNELDRRAFSIFRSVLKYGDQFFLRDPETYKLYWVDPANVEKVIVNESEGKEIEYYYIKNIDPNFEQFVATNVNPIHSRSAYSGVAGLASRGYSGLEAGLGEDQGSPIKASLVVHVSLSDGMDQNWPFGNSVLDSVYKTYRQKELLEDSVIIYRLHRAPERRVFFIDVGNMPPHKARQYLEQVKNEVKQKRIPSINNQGVSITDSVHNPMGTMEDYYFAQTCLSLFTQIPIMDGRTLTLAELIQEHQQGKTNYVYSQNTQTHELEPGKIVWASVTRKNTHTHRVILSNGSMVEATPDHRFILRSGQEVEARNLRPGDTLMPLHLDNRDRARRPELVSYVSNADGETRCVDNPTPARDDILWPLMTMEPPTDPITVVSAEPVSYKQDTGDITIQTPSGSHIFALNAGIYVHNSEGRGSKVETLPGGENLGEVDDLIYFTNKLLRGLRIPSSYLPTGAEDGTAQYNDGKVGVAYIQEYRFSKYVQRLQRQIERNLDFEFKMFMKWKGFELDSGNFAIRFTEPMNFSSYRDIQLNSERINLMGQAIGIPFISKRFAMRKYMQLSEEEIRENEQLWAEENDQTNPQGEDADGLRDMGVRPESSVNVDTDIDMDDLDDDGGDLDAGADMDMDMGGDDLGTGDQI